MEAAGTWKSHRRLELPWWREEGENPETEAWLDRAFADFSGCLFLIQGRKWTEERTEEKEFDNLPAAPTQSIQLKANRIDFSLFVFPSDTSFESAAFTGEAYFLGATFTGTVWFESPTFSHKALFERTAFFLDAWFRSATFTSITRFESATFTGTAIFDNAAFSDKTSFERTTFIGATWFVSRFSPILALRPRFPVIFR